MIKNTKILAKYLEQAMFQGEQAMMNLTWKKSHICTWHTGITYFAVTQKMQLVLS